MGTTEHGGPGAGSQADLGTAQQFPADVLVIGGGPAGAWAAIAAAAQGARVVLADKGFCGTSGATAPAGTGLWHVEPEGDARDKAKASRYALGGELAEHAWMDRVLDQTWDNVERLREWGYPFPADAAGRLRCNSLQGPEYMRLMRKQAKAAGVRILDHSPALELLRDAQGRVAGAFGVRRAQGDAWAVPAGAVVLATGGCAFLSKALGCDLLTGDGALMAAEAGARLSGMEFSNAYGLGPAFSSVTKSLFYNWATFYDGAGQPIEGAGSARGRGIIAQRLRSGPVYARLDKADAQIQSWMRAAQPNFFLSFDRLGIDPFTRLFPVALRLEGTVRGTGGLDLVGPDCATSVPGLYAAGDVATRELICGGFTGGGSHNAAWALSSGFWAGAGAAAFARAVQPLAGGAARPLRRAGGIFLQGGTGAAVDSRELVRAVQAEVFPTERNWVRAAGALHDSLHRLDALWARLRAGGALPGGSGAEAVLRAREAAALLANARWMYRSALARTETRGMHRRAEHTASDPAQRHRVLSGGLDEVWTGRQAVRQSALEAA
ncbi:FAD-binding protein [Pseudorhodoferax sp.]|uniref:FAD-binding protein n=1 Tax=Pseudorhodoferax sp. TaxID=1993553 RepID=UPI002DD69459|nr:FAD-binding protein [Pseudorhodoferax sp.]